MQDRTGEESVERRRQRIDPLHGEAVALQRSNLAAKLVELGLVRGEPEAPDTAKRVAGERLEPIEGSLGQLPQETRPLGSEGCPRVVVASDTTAERESAVAAARTACDLSCLVDADTNPGLGQRQRA